MVLPKHFTREPQKTTQINNALIVIAGHAKRKERAPTDAETTISTMATNLESKLPRTLKVWKGSCFQSCYLL